jgi:preprotein translocase subunit SecA
VTRILMISEIRMQPIDQMGDFQLPELPDFLTSHIDPFTGENDAVPQVPGRRRCWGRWAAVLVAAALAARPRPPFPDRTPMRGRA